MAKRDEEGRWWAEGSGLSEQERGPHPDQRTALEAEQKRDRRKQSRSPNKGRKRKGWGAR